MRVRYPDNPDLMEREARQTAALWAEMYTGETLAALAISLRITRRRRGSQRSQINGRAAEILESRFRVLLEGTQ